MTILATTWKLGDIIFDIENIYHVSFYKLDGIPVRCIITLNLLQVILLSLVYLINGICIQQKLLKKQKNSKKFYQKHMFKLPNL
jgi:hypothetical protein